jgi:hypothetical protein
MKKNMRWIAIALAALIIPALARGLWFYRGIPHQPEIDTPDYKALTLSQLPLETPGMDENENIKQTSGVVLFDFAHINQYQAPELQSLKEAIIKRGGQVESISDITLLEYKLKYASAYIVISPTVAFTEDELRIVQDYVERGGRLLVFTDATRSLVYYDYDADTVVNSSDASTVNPLLSPYGIAVNNDYLYNVKEYEGNFRNVFFDKFGKDELTFGLKQVAFYGTHSVKSSSGLTLLRGTESNLSSEDDAYDPAEGGAAISENGNVLAFGDFTFLTSPYQNAANNATLIANIADFTLGGKQTITLASFPYIFTQSVVQVYPTSEIKLTAETIAAISGLQASLSYVDINMAIVDKAPRDGNALILGTFTPSDDLLDFTDPFNVEFGETETSETVSMKIFGDIGRTGNGILLFEKNKKGNTLTLLADTPEDLISLLTTVASGSLSGCVLQDSIGVCSVGYSGDSSGDTGEGASTEEPTSGEAIPTPTVIPSG